MYLINTLSYLGVIIHKSLSWSPCISNIITKASRTLNFIKRNLSKCSSKVKESEYLTMVRPHLECASDVWDPHYIGDIMELEKVQRRASSKTCCLHTISHFSIQ